MIRKTMMILGTAAMTATGTAALATGANAASSPNCTHRADYIAPSEVDKTVSYRPVRTGESADMKRDQTATAYEMARRSNYEHCVHIYNEAARADVDWHATGKQTAYRDAYEGRDAYEERFQGRMENGNSVSEFVQSNLDNQKLDSRTHYSSTYGVEDDRDGTDMPRGKYDHSAGKFGSGIDQS